MSTAIVTAALFLYSIIRPVAYLLLLEKCVVMLTTHAACIRDLRLVELISPTEHLLIIGAQVNALYLGIFR